MKLKINGAEKEFEQAPQTILDVLKAEKVKEPEMVSVQFNGKILRKEEVTTGTVADGDELEFLYFMGGGAPLFR